MLPPMQRREGEEAEGKRGRTTPGFSADYPVLQHVDRRWLAGVLGLALGGAALGGCEARPLAGAPALKAPDAGVRTVEEKRKLQGEMSNTGY